MTSENATEIHSSTEDLFTDYTVSAYFPSNEPYYYQYLLEHRIMILSAESLILNPGERYSVPTNLKMSITRSPKHSYYLLPHDKLPLRLENEGFVHTSFRGRVHLSIVNITNNTVNIPSGFIVGFIF